MAFEAIEASYIGQQLKDNIGRMVSNMRDNAGGYKSAIAAGRAVDEIAKIMVGDFNDFLRRIKMVSDLASRNSTKFTAAVQSNGWTVAELNSLRAQLVGVCNHVVSASLTTGAEINTEADFILANVPIFERTF